MFAIALCTLCMSMTSPCHAGDDADAKSQARELASSGIRALEAGNTAEALLLLERAERLFHAPTHVLFMARAYAQAGRDAEAHDAYVRVVDEDLPAGAHAAFVQARDQAATELAELVHRLHRIQLRVVGVGANEARVYIDGVLLDSLPQHPVVLAPGQHRVEVRSASQPPVERPIELTVPGEVMDVVVELAIDGADADASPDAQADDGADDGPGPHTVAAFATFGLGAAALITGIVTGAVTLTDASDIESRCIDNACLNSDAERGSDATTLGWVSTGSLIAAGVATAVGVTLLVVGDDGEQASSADRVQPHVAMRLRANSISLAGSF